MDREDYIRALDIKEQSKENERKFENETKQYLSYEEAYKAGHNKEDAAHAITFKKSKWIDVLVVLTLIIAIVLMYSLFVDTTHMFMVSLGFVTFYYFCVGMYIRTIVEGNEVADRIRNRFPDDKHYFRYLKELEENAKLYNTKGISIETVDKLKNGTFV